MKGPLDVPQRAHGCTAEALQRQLDDGVAAHFDIDARRITPNRVDLSVIANRRDGSRVAMKFA